MAGIQYVEVARTTSARPTPPAPNGSNPRAGQPEFLTVVVRRGVWPADGTLYAGHSYDDEMHYLSPTPPHPAASQPGQLVAHANYPTTAQDLARDAWYAADCPPWKEPTL
jgi:hypothetical protein